MVEARGDTEVSLEAESMDFPGWILTALIVGHSLGEMSIPVIVGNFISGHRQSHALPLTIVTTSCMAFFLFYLLWFIATRCERFLGQKECLVIVFVALSFSVKSTISLAGWQGQYVM